MGNMKMMAAAMTVVLLTAAFICFDSDRELTWEDLENYDVSSANILSKYTNEVTLRTVSHFAMLNAGISESMLGDYPSYWDSMAHACGITHGEQLDRSGTNDDLKRYIRQSSALKDSLESGTPLFIDGASAPIFGFTDGKTDGYTNQNSYIMRFCVYVETGHDTDLDGKRDLVKVFIQVPRAAMEGKYKAPVIFEARCYSAGMTPGSFVIPGNDYDVDGMYHSPDPRTVSSMMDPMEHALSSVQSEWYYHLPDGEDCYDRMDALDDLLVRGFAFATCSGIGTYGSEGVQTCGSDLEIDAYRSVIEWFCGKGVAFTDRTSNVNIAADWSNGNVGMIGKSYAGATCIALAALGIDNLKTVYEYSGLNSWYNYTNSQGMSAYPGMSYQDLFASMNSTRCYDTDWSDISDRYLRYIGYMRSTEIADDGDFNGEWAKREYTDVKKSDTVVMICHGINDYNVPVSFAYDMYRMFDEAGVKTKIILHQGGHDYLTEGIDRYDFYIGDVLSSDLINRWFTLHLFGVDNDVMDLPQISVQSKDCRSWVSYDEWGNEAKRVYEFPSETVTLTKSDLNVKELQKPEQMANLQAGTYYMDIDQTGLIDGTAEFHLHIRTDDTGRNSLPVSVYLFDISNDGFVSAEVASAEAKTVMVSEGGSWVGGGLPNYDILNFRTVPTHVKTVSMGYADLYNPNATRDPVTCTERVELDGGWYDYTIYVRPALYDVQEGHRLRAVISTMPVGVNTVLIMDAMTADYSFIIDLEYSWVSIPFS